MTNFLFGNNQSSSARFRTSLILKFLLCLLVLFSTFVTQSIYANEAEIIQLYRRIDFQLKKHWQQSLSADRQIKVLASKNLGLDVKEELAAIKELLQKQKKNLQQHQSNAKKIFVAERWIDVMREGADKVLAESFRLTWKIQTQLIQAQIALIRLEQVQFNNKTSDQYQPIADSYSVRKETTSKWYEEYLKKMAALRAPITQTLIQHQSKWLSEYQQTAKRYTAFRRIHLHDAWNWYHFYVDSGFGPEKGSRANRFQSTTLYQRFAFEIPRARKKQLEFYTEYGVWDNSDIDWFIGFPFSKDRLILDQIKIHSLIDSEKLTAKSLYKLNSYVKNEPVELFDDVSFNAKPVRVSGTPLEQLAKILRSRTVHHIKLQKEVKNQALELRQTATKLSHLTWFYNDLYQWQESIKKLNQRLTLNDEKIELIKATQQDIEELGQQIDRQYQSVEKQQQVINEKKQGASNITVVFEFDRWNKAKANRRGIPFAKVKQRLQTKVLNLQGALPNLDEVTAKRIKSKIAAYQQQLKGLEALANPELSKEYKKLAQLRNDRKKSYQELSQTKKKLDDMLKKFGSMDKLQPIEKDEQLRADYQILNREYSAERKQYIKMIDKHAELIKNALPEEFPDIDQRGINLNETLRKIDNFSEANLKIWLKEKQNKVGEQLGKAKILDRKQQSIAKALQVIRKQTINSLPYLLVQNGASKTDPLVSYFDQVKIGLELTEAVLDVKPKGMHKIEEKIHGSANDVAKYFLAKLESSKLEEIGEGMSSFKTASDYLKKSMNILETGRMLTTSNPDSSPIAGLTYLSKVASLVKDGSSYLGSAGKAVSAYADYFAGSIAAIEKKAKGINKRMLSNATKFDFLVPPENHLYTEKEVRTNADLANYNDFKRLAIAFQARRIAILLTATNMAQAQERSMYNKSRAVRN